MGSRRTDDGESVPFHGAFSRSLDGPAVSRGVGASRALELLAGASIGYAWDDIPFAFEGRDHLSGAPIFSIAYVE
jgi:hypothetical protein